MYSHHPDPRRVWKGGSEQHLLTPLPGAPRAPRAPRAPGSPGASSKKLDLVLFYNAFCTFAGKMKILHIIPIIPGGGVRSRYIFAGTSRS